MTTAHHSSPRWFLTVNSSDYNTLTPVVLLVLLSRIKDHEHKVTRFGHRNDL